jgi:hypothetical protein
MAHHNQHPAVRKSGPGRGLMPRRREAPLVVAALGTWLLVSAIAQPLLPRTLFTSSAGDWPVMSRPWQALLITLPLAACTWAVLRGWRHIPGSAAALAGGLSAAVLAANVFVLYRAVSVLDIMADRAGWRDYGILLALPFLSAAATVLLAIAPARRFASGALLALGAAGSLVYLAGLLEFLSGAAPQYGAPGRAFFAGILGSGVILAAGMAGRSADADPVSKAGGSAARSAQAAIAAGTLALAAAAVTYLVASFRSASLAGLADSAWELTPLAGLAAVSCVAAVTRRPTDRRVAAGVMLTAGMLTLLYFPYSHVLAGLLPGSGALPGTLRVSGDLAAAASAAFALAGVVLLRSRRPPRDAGPGPAPARDDLAYSESTRYLCAAAHLDNRFARRVVQLVMADGQQAVAPSPGIDLATVLAHCCAAWRRQKIRDVLLTVIELAALPLVLAFRTPAGLRDAAVLIALAAAIVLGERWTGRYRVAARQLTRAAFDPARAPSLSGAEQDQAGQLPAPERGNVSVYGTYSPFVGSGTSHGGWSFALNLARGREPLGSQARREPGQFEIEELYAAVQDGIDGLGLAGLLIENTLLVDGRSVRDDSRFIPDQEHRPVATIDGEQLAKIMRAPELVNRTYQCVRMQDWEGDTILSVFINFSRRGSGLSAEVQHFVLGPVKNEYREVDVLASRSRAGQLRDELRVSARVVAGTMLRAPFVLTGTIFRIGPRWDPKDPGQRPAGAERNLGAMESVRQLGQSGSFRRYFQQVDHDLHKKLIDRQVLDSIMEFLDAHDIDISQFEEQRMTILNHGLLISGGQLNAGSVAVGEGARARMTQFTHGIQDLVRKGDRRPGDTV